MPVDSRNGYIWDRPALARLTIPEDAVDEAFTLTRSGLGINNAWQEALLVLVMEPRAASFLVLKTDANELVLIPINDIAADCYGMLVHVCNTPDDSFRHKVLAKMNAFYPPIPETI